MYLDADEQLVPEAARPELRSLLGKTWREAFYLVETNYTGGEGSGESVAHLALRVFGATGPSTASQGASTSRRRSRCRPTCPSGSRRTDGPDPPLRLPQEPHLGQGEVARNIELLEAQVEESGLNAFAAFNLGTEWMVAGDPRRRASTSTRRG